MLLVYLSAKRYEVLRFPIDVAASPPFVLKTFPSVTSPYFGTYLRNCHLFPHVILNVHANSFWIFFISFFLEVNNSNNSVGQLLKIYFVNRNGSSNFIITMYERMICISNWLCSSLVMTPLIGGGSWLMIYNWFSLGSLIYLSLWTFNNDL